MWNYLAFLCGFLILLFCSCERLDGETVVEGKVVDRHTGDAIPNATVVVHSGKISNGFTGGAYNTFEFEKQADNKGNFAFRFEGKGDRNYVLRAFKDPGYYTAFDDAAYLEEGRNNKKLKIKMQAPAWVRVKLVNTPPKDVVQVFYMQGFSDMINGEQGSIFYRLHRDTIFVRMVMGNRETTFLVDIDTVGNSQVENMIRLNPLAYFPALDTTNLVIHY
ncbi:carboxypeptidase regulatory-like domain-containing protein [Adhaeribacter sp. BT258]|uniref:Carboxypeptidase regulatory-like domain-containing protein n=1 Tax=Adhaeribacter terrigena TaxID=2793070 RepID=A0ABS1C4W4_9BACT|nr:carboxypeptidase-like regulatory domain-containing protein [Adhaeribacter terrigena]MBK0404442.1 carboxypeptidase regulatory-like domain-containing protein [Adhaeribacter terrigena]